MILSDVPINSNINKLKVNPNELDINNNWNGYSNLFGYMLSWIM